MSQDAFYLSDFVLLYCVLRYSFFLVSLQDFIIRYSVDEADLFTF